MKKRSLFKRLLSGFVATAMALSICFSDKVFEDLFASAENANAYRSIRFTPSTIVGSARGGLKISVDKSFV